MSDPTDEKPYQEPPGPAPGNAESASAPAPSPERQARLDREAAALRENLRRRKLDQGNRKP